MLKKIFSIEIKENILHICIAGISIKHKFKNSIYVIDENSVKRRVRGIKGLKIVFEGENSTVTIHKPIPKFVASSILIRNNCNVEIGTSKHEIKKMKILMSKKNCNVHIGKDFSAKNNLSILCNSESNKNVFIGDDCMFGSYVMIRTGDVHTIYDKDYNVLNYGGDVIIKDNVWIGYGVTILKNVTIEKGCIVGTHSLVNKNCDKPHSIYAGTPAKFIKENVFWDRYAIEKFQRKIAKEKKKKITEVTPEC